VKLAVSLACDPFDYARDTSAVSGEASNRNQVGHTARHAADVTPLRPMAPKHPRVGVTRDPELAAALDATRSLVPPADARAEAAHVRRLALIGARSLQSSGDAAFAERARERIRAVTGARPPTVDFEQVLAQLSGQGVDRGAELSKALDWVRGER